VVQSILPKTVTEIVLAAVLFLDDHDDIALVGEHPMLAIFSSAKNFRIVVNTPGKSIRTLSRLAQSQKRFLQSLAKLPATAEDVAPRLVDGIQFLAVDGFHIHRAAKKSMGAL
jgi:hypothetical protein